MHFFFMASFTPPFLICCNIQANRTFKHPLWLQEALCFLSSCFLFTTLFRVPPHYVEICSHHSQQALCLSLQNQAALNNLPSEAELG